MRAPRPTGIRRLLVAWLLAIATLPAPEIAADESVTLIITHPIPREIENFTRLVERELIRVPGLRLVGVHHANEREDYATSRAMVAAQGSQGPWAEIRELDCRLTPADVYRKNACTPAFAALLDEAAGIVFTGGADMPPDLYGETTMLTTHIRDPDRHFFEVSFLFHLLGSSRNPKIVPLLTARPKKLVLGICLGMQSMNVAAGGSLIQDIPAEVHGVTTLEAVARLEPDRLHRNIHRLLDPAPGVSVMVPHPVLLTGGTAIRKALGAGRGPYRVASGHHQAIERLGHDLRVLARSLDGKVVEGVTHRRFPGVLGVQFHPEWGALFDTTLESRERRGHPVANHLAHALDEHPASAEFHLAFWRLVSERIRKSAAASGRKSSP